MQETELEATTRLGSSGERRKENEREPVFHTVQVFKSHISTIRILLDHASWKYKME
jgi:hypothetical protein